MGINEKILKEIKEKIKQEIKETGNIGEVINTENIEKYLLEYLRKLDPVELANKYGATLDEAIESIELLQSNDELRKIVLMLD